MEMQQVTAAQTRAEQGNQPHSASHSSQPELLGILVFFRARGDERRLYRSKRPDAQLPLQFGDHLR